jgi:hypothetical protein
VSAATVALALVAQATEFGNRFYVFALLVLPVALFVGLATFQKREEAGEARRGVTLYGPSLEPAA